MNHRNTWQILVFLRLMGTSNTQIHFFEDLGYCGLKLENSNRILGIVCDILG
jgi:hypothetical protein